MKRARVRLERALRLHLRDECEVKLWGTEAQPCQACANFNDAIHDAIERERATKEAGR